MTRLRARHLLSATVAALVFAFLAVPAFAAASPPRWALESQVNTNVAPGTNAIYSIQVTNVGTEPTVPGSCPGPECQSVAVTLPDDLTAVRTLRLSLEFPWNCAIVDPHHVVCTLEGREVPFAASDPAGVGINPENALPKFQVVAEASPTASGAAVAEITASGGGAAPATIHDGMTISGEPTAFGIGAFDSSATDASGGALRWAGAHPDLFATDFDLTRGTDPLRTALWPLAPVRDTVVDLPPGFVLNPTAVPTCSVAQITNSENTSSKPACPSASQIGLATVVFAYGSYDAFQSQTVAVYNMPAPLGIAGRAGFVVSGSLVTIDGTVRGGGDYGVTIASDQIPAALAIISTHFDMWGVPAAGSHTPVRGCPGEWNPYSTGPSCESGAPELAFYRNPTDCSKESTGLTTTIRADSWFEPGNWKQATSVSHRAPGYPYPSDERGAAVGPTNCADVPFTPAATVQPTSARADSPTGLDVRLNVPQEGLTIPAAIAQSDLKKAVVALPQGMSVNPSSAIGLGACTSAQIGLLGTHFAAPAPIRFTNAAPNCPDSSKIGTAEVTTPLLDHKIKLGVYLAAQGDNPFGSMLAMYIAGRDPQSGVVLKLPGKIEADPTTGRLTTTFDNQPQQPFDELHLELFGGPRAALRTPAACGSYAVQTSLTPWSGGATVSRNTPFQITQGCGGGFSPHLSAGTANPIAGLTSPFTLRLTREDGERELTGLTATLPAGLSGYLRGIPYCPDSALAAVSGAEGTGVAQEQSPSCPAASQVGTVTVGAGAGASPFYTQSGRAYLAGPYRGAPLSLATIVPAVAGPFDLGSVLVRNAIRVDQRTAQLTVVSDPLPTILHGIPLDLRDIRVEINRSHFTLNPTSCEEARIGSVVTGTGGASASPSERFQVAGCGDLAFKPKLKLQLKGATRRSGHPALKAVLTYPKKGTYANLARAQVGLPHSEFLDQGNLNKVCKQADLQAGTCPKRSIYGHAKAWTPLLDKPLEGPVYLGVGFGYKLPALVADLNGQIRILLVGRIDTTKRKGIRSTFEVVPDAPVSRFVLRMKGGKKYGLLENSENTCRRKQRASAVFNAHNGARLHMRPKIAYGCGKAKRRANRKHR